MRSIDETHNEYGTLLVQNKLPARNGKTHWRCLCDVCGQTSDIAGSDLRTKKVTTCACQQDKREYPNVLGLQKRVDALVEQLETATARIAALEAAKAVGYTLPDITDFPVMPLEELDVVFKGPKVLPSPVQRLEEIFALPFEARSDMRSLQTEIKSLMQAETKDITASKMADGGARAFDKDLADRTNALVRYSKLLQKFHLHPRDL